MGSGKPVTPEVQWIVVRMCASMTDRDVSMYTGISERKVQSIRQHFNKTGEITVPNRLRPKLHQALTDADIEVHS